MSSSLNAEDDPGLMSGADIFAERCVLCHGNRGMGDGVLTLLMDNYPSANLVNQRYGNRHRDIVENIRFGGMKGKMSLFSPPWENELTPQEISAVALFVGHLYQHPESAAELLDGAAGKSANDIARGRFLFLSRCVVCHGEDGQGDGKLAGKVIKDPLPYDLTQSVRPQQYIEQIIRRGGAAMERSGNMPPWGEEFTGQDITALAAYLMTLRKAGDQAGDV
ncbi:c-type cytochrome [Aliamphritea hakodatensis]|uniref:c-type cytochrome n=1 Tax=Aliamphritea hakodatensis TaxID=2895352 RepID=UPI0022FD910C|nr:c-type cytochrome [Aliamphritea hakodatensis]